LICGQRVSDGYEIGEKLPPTIWTEVLAEEREIHSMRKFGLQTEFRLSKLANELSMMADRTPE
jgi:hypothetical protein